LLVEQADRLGGAPLDGMHAFICGLYRHDPAAPFDPLNGGLTAEIISRMDELASTDGRRRMGKVEVHAFRGEVYERALAELTRGESGLTVVTGRRVVSAAVAGGAVRSLTLSGGVPDRVGCGRAIDATGDGALLALCGAGREPEAGEEQLAGYCFRLSGVADIEGLTPIKVPYCVRKAIDAGVLPGVLRHTVFTREDGGTGGVCKLSVPPDFGRNGVEEARTLGERVCRVLRGNTSEFRRAVVEEWSPRVLPRGGRTLVGEYRLTEEDVLGGRRFEDGCVKAAWPVEFWDPASGLVLDYLAPGAHYDVPARCLQSPRIRNLFASGRCVSATGRALASLRVVGTCFALGEGAARVALGE